ncbi:MAG: 50S ribosomal protein L29 [Nanoarchaeota archaeon]
MALIKKNELNKMETPQLLEKKMELQKEMIKVNAQLSTKTTPENPGRIRAIKKTIARINTRVTMLRKAPQKKPESQKKSKEVKKTKE